jgi:hypothetical protein
MNIITSVEHERTWLARLTNPLFRKSPARALSVVMTDALFAIEHGHGTLTTTDAARYIRKTEIGFNQQLSDTGSLTIS